MKKVLFKDRCCFVCIALGLVAVAAFTWMIFLNLLTFWQDSAGFNDMVTLTNY